MRNIAAVTLAASLFATTAVAADLPLAAGKPAGVNAAQSYRDNTIIYVIGIAAIAAGIALASGDHHHGLIGGGNGSGGNTGNGGGSTTTTTTTTTT